MSDPRNKLQNMFEEAILIAAVRDADKQDDPRENIFKLPGRKPPEKELFDSEAVTTLVRTNYGLDLVDFQTEISGVDHHYWCERLANRVGSDENGITWELARVYARSLPENETSTLVNLLKEATRN